MSLVVLAVLVTLGGSGGAVAARGGGGGHMRVSGHTATALAFQELQMESGRVGWALADPAGSPAVARGAWGVWRTSSGGTAWRAATPDHLPDLRLPVADFVSQLEAWVAMPAAPHDGRAGVRLYHTVDGGVTWRARRIPSPYQSEAAVAVSVDFVSSRVGWVMLVAGAASGAFGAPAAILRTRDGGRTWQVAGATGGQPSRLPYAGTVTFLTSEDGWLTGGGPPGAPPYVTHDGGRTWRAVSLPDPAPACGYALLQTGPPTFFAPRSVWGIMAAATWVPTSAATAEGGAVYATSDGGRRWRTLPVPWCNMMTVSFADRAHGWIWAWNGQTVGEIGGRQPVQGELLRTDDGGTSWALMPLDKAFRQICCGAGSTGVMRLDFVTPTVGWAVGVDGLLATTDGGGTWREVYR